MAYTVDKFAFDVTAILFLFAVGAVIGWLLTL